MEQWNQSKLDPKDRSLPRWTPHRTRRTPIASIMPPPASVRPAALGDFGMTGDDRNSAGEMHGVCFRVDPEWQLDPFKATYIPEHLLRS